MVKIQVKKLRALVTHEEINVKKPATILRHFEDYHLSTSSHSPVSSWLKLEEDLSAIYFKFPSSKLNQTSALVEILIKPEMLKEETFT